jgi:hypothetical protein
VSSFTFTFYGVTQPYGARWIKNLNYSIQYVLVYLWWWFQILVLLRIFPHRELFIGSFFYSKLFVSVAPDIVLPPNRCIHLLKAPSLESSNPAAFSAWTYDCLLVDISLGTGRSVIVLGLRVLCERDELLADSEETQTNSYRDLVWPRISGPLTWRRTIWPRARLHE